jgi:hypothetical protein
MHTWYNNEAGPSRNMWAIVDKVQVPNITGDFVLRWRWDAEQVQSSPAHILSSLTVLGCHAQAIACVLDMQNPQIWSHCADVRINAQ